MRWTNSAEDKVTRGETPVSWPWTPIHAFLWSERTERRAGLGWLIRALRVAALSVENALGNRLPFQASALTFVTLLGMVPALAFVFALAKGFGFAGTLRGLMIENFSDYQREVLERILQYVENTKVGTLGAVGLLLLLGTVVTTIASVEDTFNHIWRVREQRAWARRVTDYLSILMVVPLLVVAAVAVWASLSSAAVIGWLAEVQVIGDMTRLAMRVVPFLALVAAFSFLYLYLPNTRVPVRSAVLAGLVAATLWWAMQTIYIQFQVGVSKYNAIYGGFASLPLFMAWLQVSWTIVLYGSELAHAHQACRTGFHPLRATRRAAMVEAEALALQLMSRVASAFDGGEAPPSAADLANALNVDRADVESLAAPLIAAGLLCRDAQRDALRPARSLDRITVADVVEAVEGGAAPSASLESADPRLVGLLQEARQIRRAHLERITVLEVVRGRSPAASDQPPG